ncbi:CBO0543 family protein [Schinkia azotoformans]|uniref:CBO0543 family protein n=1 Tax=Schinkia azotoformans TaxID=1454 RepID=UPI002DBF1E9F|nr:CBO0543 family protein [Schinkia azotoformans]
MTCCSGLFVQSGYFIGFSTVLTTIEVMLEKYTDLIKYIHWAWYISWITICISLFIVCLFCVWFLAKGNS